MANILFFALHRNFTKTNVLYFFQHLLLHIAFELQIKHRHYGFCCKKFALPARCHHTGH